MKIAISSTGQTLDSTVDARFGRCPYFLIVDPDTLDLISPIFHFEGITAAIKLYHGTDDTVVPVSSS